MSRLKIVTAHRLEKLIFHLGFFRTRQKGSHVFYRHADGRTTTIPHHPGRDISKPLIREILREIKLDPDAYNKLLEEI